VRIASVERPDGSPNANGHIPCAEAGVVEQDPLPLAYSGVRPTCSSSAASTSVRRAAARLDAALERVIGRRSAEDAAASPYGGLASRGAALFLDAVLTNGALLVTAALVGAAGSLLDVSLNGWVQAALAGSLGTVLIGGYLVLIWSTVGQTPGMRVLGLRVTDGAGRVLGAGRSLLRLAASVVAIAPLFLGMVPVLFDRRRRALQDFVARSVVVRDEPGGEPAQ